MSHSETNEINQMKARYKELRTLKATTVQPLLMTCMLPKPLPRSQTR